MGRHVLVPIDGSEPAWKALDHAVETIADGRLTVLNVIDPAEGVYGNSDGGYFDPGAFDRARDRGEKLCEQARERLETAGTLEQVDLETAVEAGRPARTIIDYVSDHSVDHVVMGSRGRTGVSRILLGSVAETVTRRSPVPVTIVR